MSKLYLRPSRRLSRQLEMRVCFEAGVGDLRMRAAGQLSSFGKLVHGK